MKRIVLAFLFVLLLLTGCRPLVEREPVSTVSDPVAELAQSLAIYREEDLYELASVLLASDSGTEAYLVSEEMFASGEIAYLLQQAMEEKGTADQIWGQEIGKDPYPVLNGKKVYQVIHCGGQEGYSNSPVGSGHIPGGDDGDCTTGVLCIRCGEVALPGNDTHDWRQATCILPKTCTLCGTTYGQALGHRYQKGICVVCGEAEPGSVESPVITLKFPTLSFKDEILMNVYFEANNMDHVKEAGLITFGTQVSTWSIDNAEKVISGYRYSEANGLYVVTTDGIPAKNMGDELWFSVYAKLSDGSYVYSKLVSYSPRQYAYSLLGTADTKLDRLLIAMLNYGAAAQSYFGHNTQSPVNEALTQEQKIMVSAYSGSMITSVGAVPARKQGSFTANGGFANCYPSVSFKGALSINYYCKPFSQPLGEITLFYWKQADYTAVDVLTEENATGTVTMTKTAGGEYSASVKGIPARQINSAVYVAISYSDGINTYRSGILPYSIGEYCRYYAERSHPFTPLAQATAVYGHYAGQYFG